MAENGSLWASARLRGLQIAELIAHPLEAIVRSQNKMSIEQVQLLLRYCFKETKKHGHTVYEPCMLLMTLRRGYLEPGPTPGSPPTIETVETEFYVPVLTLFPLAMIGVNDVNIDFGVEVTAQFSVDDQPPPADGDANTGGEGPAPRGNGLRNTVMLGRIAKRGSALQGADVSIGAVYNIDVSAGPLPLSPGLSYILEIYSKSIDPLAMPKDAPATPADEE